MTTKETARFLMGFTHGETSVPPKPYDLGSVMTALGKVIRDAKVDEFGGLNFTKIDNGKLVIYDSHNDAVGVSALDDRHMALVYRELADLLCEVPEEKFFGRHDKRPALEEIKFRAGLATVA